MNGVTGAGPLLSLAVVVLLIGTGLALWGAGRARRRVSLPQGRIIYADTGDWRPQQEPLFSPRYQLVGKPDYLVATRAGIVPVEVKSGRTPSSPYDSHVLQLAAYCLLVEETAGRRPRHGLIRYPAATFQVDYTPALRRGVLSALRAMRADLGMTDVSRSHNDPGRCAGCGYRVECGEALSNGRGG